MNGFLFVLILSPAACREEQQNRENFKSACQHIEYEDKLGKNAEIPKIHHRSNSFKTGTDIVKAREHCRKVGSNRETVKANKDKTYEQNQHVCRKISVNARHNFFIYRTTVNTNDFHSVGENHLTNVTAQSLKQKKDACAFHATAGAACAGSCNHQNGQNSFGEGRPQIKIDGGISRCGNDTCNLESRVAKSLA